MLIVADSYGGCSSVGRAPGCGPGSRGFKSHHSPHFFPDFFPAPVAQLDRASDFESAGRGFESLRARQKTSIAHPIFSPRFLSGIDKFRSYAAVGFNTGSPLKTCFHPVPAQSVNAVRSGRKWIAGFFILIFLTL